MHQKLIIVLTPHETFIEWCTKGIFILFIPLLPPTTDEICELLLREKAEKAERNIYPTSARPMFPFYVCLESCSMCHRIIDFILQKHLKWEISRRLSIKTLLFWLKKNITSWPCFIIAKTESTGRNSQNAVMHTNINAIAHSQTHNHWILQHLNCNFLHDFGHEQIVC